MVENLSHVMILLIKHPGYALELPLRIAQSCHKILPFYSPRYPRLLLQAARLFLAKGFKPQEAMQLGLLELDFPDSELCKFTSKVEMLRIQTRINPKAWRSVAGDKSIFYMYCNALGIPVPKLYAIFFKGIAGYSTDGRVLQSRGAWEKYFNLDMPAEFVVKPVAGGYGAGVMAFVRTSHDEFTDVVSAKAYKAKDLYYRMVSYADDNAFVIQERLKNHPELVRLSDTKYLQTLRILTFVDRDGQCRILHAFLKPIVGQNLTDNHDHGKSGNLLAEVSLGNGRLKPAVTMTPDVSGLRTVFSHPKTGVSFEGFPIPLWDEACVLAKEAALKFMPLRTIGWDIALTPNGPSIVEGNWNSDPPSFHKTMEVILDALC